MTWGVSGMSIWEETQRKTQDLLEKWYLSTGMGTSWDPLGGAGGGGWWEQCLITRQDNITLRLYLRYMQQTRLSQLISKQLLAYEAVAAADKGTETPGVK